MLLPFSIDETGYTVRHKPFATAAICLACVVFGGAAFGALSESSLEDMAYKFGYVPLDFKWYRPITCTFIHAHWQHLIGNLCFLWIYGSALEKLIGLPRLLLIYLCGAYASVLAHGLSLRSWMQDVPAIGASGAISAILGAFLVMLPTVRIQFLVFSPIYSRPLPSSGPAHFVIGSWFLVQIFFCLKMVGDVGQIAFWAHIAGFGAGAFIAWAMLTIGRIAAKPSKEETAPSETPFEKAVKLWSAGERELALREAVGAFASARGAYDNGAMLQIYSWLIFDPEHGEIAPWIHRDAVFACLRMKRPDLALHAMAKAIAANSVDDVKKALLSFKAALEKSGRKDLAEEADALLAGL